MKQSVGLNLNYVSPKMTKSLMKNPHKVLPQLVAAIIGSWGFFCTGLVRGWSSPGIPSLVESKRVDVEPVDVSWLAAMAPLCALTGAFLASYPLQVLGRRKTLILACFPFITGFEILGFTYFGRHKAMLFVGRAMSGLMNGVLTPSSQIYISECASPRVRGVLGSLTASALALGILVPYIIGAFVPWHTLAWILGSFPLVLLIGMIFLPETPVWLLAHGREEEARKSLQRLRGKRTNIEAEFQRIKENLAKTTTQSKIHPRELLKGSVWKPLLISMGIMFFQQFTGINAMVFYTVSIFKSAGSTIDKNYATIIVGFVQLICTAASGSLVDRFGRRLLLLSSASIVSLSLAAMGTFFYFQSVWGENEASAALGWLPLVSLIVFFIAFSGGFANVPFIIMGELFPARYRNILGSTSSSFNLLCTFIVVRSFPDMQKGMTKHGTFWFYMCCTLVSMVFVFFLLPETKGKTLEDIEKIFSNKYNADGTLKAIETVESGVTQVDKSHPTGDELKSKRSHVETADPDNEPTQITSSGTSPSKSVSKAYVNEAYVSEPSEPRNELSGHVDSEDEDDDGIPVPIPA